MADALFDVCTAFAVVAAIGLLVAGLIALAHLFDVGSP